MSHAALDFSRFDHTINPADDLFMHVNGSWIAAATIPDDKTAIGSFENLRDESEKAIHEICESLARDVMDPSSEKGKIAALYRCFMDEDTIERLGGSPIKPIIDRIDSIATIDDLRNWFGWAIAHGISSLIDADVDSDPGDPTRYLLFVAQSGIGLPDEAYYHEPQHAAICEKYRAYLAKTIALAEGRSTSTADDEASALQVWDLEKAIAMCHWDIVKTRDIVAMYNLRDREEMEAEAPQLGWDAILTAAGISDQITQTVNCQPSFFTDVSSLLHDDLLPAWRAWAKCNTLTSLSPFLASEYVDLRFSFYGTALTGQPVNRPRWKRGVAFTEAAMGEALGKQYVQDHFPPQAEQRMESLVKNLLDAYRESITHLTWLGDQTKAEALRKLDNFRPKIGHPKTWRDYSALRVGDDLMSNVLAVNEFAIEYEIGKLSRPVDVDEWFMYPQTVNAYYHPLRNEIVFPAAILQPPFFNVDADDAVNYGGIGAVIGHEIGHGFDDEGSACDGEGRLRDWWTPEDHAAFEERTHALVKQYSALSPRQAPTLKVNGELTLGENIGDLGGLGIAIRAWKMAGGQSDPPIDDLTGIQRLFLSWAAIWSYIARDELVATRLATDPHSPSEIRCNQVVRNIDDFYQAFDVRESNEEFLPPEERVTIW